ncbi:MAG: hypothetical protein ACK6D5_09235, partial [Planctomyces sp.]
IGVLEPPEVGCGGDEDTVFPDDDACGPGEIAGEDGTAIEGAIIVVIEEQSNFSDGQIGGAFAVGFAWVEVPGRLWGCWLGVMVLGACGGVGAAHD